MRIKRERTIFHEDVAAEKESVFSRVFVCEESDDGRAVEGDASPRRDLTAVAAAERRVNQIYGGVRIGHFGVQVDIFVAAPKDER